MNYGELKSQFEGLLNRRDLTPTQRDSFIQMAIAKAQRKLRVPAMEQSVSVTILPDYTALPIPADLIELINITHDTYRLRRVDLTTALTSAAASTGNPKVYARQGGNWVLGPTPDEGDVVRVDYYKEFDELLEDEDENFISIIAPDSLVYLALGFACRHFLDARADSFEALGLGALAEVQAQGDNDELSGGASMTPTYAYPAED